MIITRSHRLFVNLRSWHFRQACSHHNLHCGRHLCWADARALWRAAHAAACQHVYGTTMRWSGR